MTRWQTVGPGEGRGAPVLGRGQRLGTAGGLAVAVFLAGVGLTPVGPGRAQVLAQVQAPAPVPTQTREPASSPGTLPPVAPPANPTQPGAAAEEGAGKIPQVADLTTRYRFIEHYTTDPSKAQPGEVGQYRVASRDVIRIVTDKPPGAPDRSERVVQVIYTERPAVVSSLGQLTDTVRRYDALRVSPALETRPSAARPLEGLELWYKAKPGGVPKVMSLTEGRRISEAEYGITLRQLFLPDLIAALPSLPSRVGDRWRIPRVAAQALLGDKPMQGSEGLMGMLQQVRPEPSVNGMVATVAVTGRAILPQTGETVLNAQVVFAFTPASGAGAGAGAEPADAATGIVEARGAIIEVRLARVSSSAVPGSNGRLRSALTWELSLQRRLGTGDPLAVPAAAPAATEANSWLTYDDPEGRFHFRHPQDYLPQKPPFLAKDDLIQLGDSAAGSDEGRIITLRLQPKSGNPVEDRANLDPDSHVKELNDEWLKSRQDVTRGPSGWLPDADWAANKMRVYRIEAALRPKGPEGRNVPRIFLDYYLVVFTQNESLVVTAMTGQDPPLPFRKEVESILRTFQLGPSKAAGGTVAEPVAVPVPATTGTTPAAAPRPATSPPR
jgi:hypothetical protein